MTDRTPENSLAELEEKVRMLVLENDHLAERAEETLLLGLIAEKINAINDVDQLIQVGLEQTALLKDIPYAACFGLEGECAQPLHIFRSTSDQESVGSPVPLAPELTVGLQNGGCVLQGPDLDHFPFFETETLRPLMTVLLPLGSRFGQQMLFVFATDQEPERLAAMNFLLPRVVEMVIARLDNIELLARLTRMNEDLDQTVNERTKELRASETRIRTLFERAFDAIFVVDHQGVVRDVNEQACTALGYERDELLGVSVLTLSTVLDEDRLEAIKARSVNGPAQVVETEHRRKDGTTFPVEVRVGPIEIDGETMLLAQARDVSERNRLLEQLNQAQKMEAVGRLAGGIAHDFNNILTVIMGHIDLLRMELAPEGPGRDELRAIRRTTEKAARLTQQLLAFSRKQVMDMVPFDLSRDFTDMSRMLRRMIDENIELEMDLEEGPCMVFGDPGRVEQILMNLVINARDAMPQGGHLRVRTRRVPRNDEYSKALPDGPPPTGRYIRVQVTDTGEGIPLDIQSKIFDPFFTTKEVGKGTGLGLAMVYGLAQQHNARVQVHSPPGQGATFEVIFPEVEGEEKDAADKGQGVIPQGQETLLLVEDDPNIRSVLSRMIEKLGYTLLQAGDGEDALRVIADHGRAVDLVLTDVIMPRMGGGELIRQLKAIYPSLRVIYMSGYTDDAVDRAELAAPTTRFLQKPVSYPQLARELREVLDTPD